MYTTNSKDDIANMDEPEVIQVYLHDDDETARYEIDTEGKVYDIENACYLISNEDYEMIANENRHMANTLKLKGFSSDEISDIANGAI